MTAYIIRYNNGKQPNYYNHVEDVKQRIIHDGGAIKSIHTLSAPIHFSIDTVVTLGVGPAIIPRPKYSNKQKIEMIMYYLGHSSSQAATAKRFGCSEAALNRWVGQYSRNEL